LPAADPIAGFGNWRKVGGILCQAVPGVGIVVGIGINAIMSQAELPVPTATSLSLFGPAPDTSAIQAAILAELANVIDEWERFGDSELRAEFESYCVSIGRPVLLEHERDDAAALTGIGRSIAPDGGLVIESDNAELVTVHAGDVWLRLS